MASGENCGSNPISEHIRHLAFCKVLKLSKKPFEDDWVNHPYTYEQILPWVLAGNNYGILSGYHDLVTADCDCKKYFDLARKFIAPTFTVQSSSADRGHLLLCIPDFKKFAGDGTNKFSLVDPDDPENPKKQGGDIRASGFQTIGPGSLHPDTHKPYIICDDRPIAVVSFSAILDVFGEYIRTSVVPPAPVEGGEGRSIYFPIADVLNYYKVDLKKCRGSGEYFGAHPVHGSDTGANFWVNTQGNTWHCFRCNSGGGTLMLIAVREGIIDCSEAKKGGLKGEKFLETCRIAEQKFGFKMLTDFKVPESLRSNTNTKAKVDDVDFVDMWHLKIFPSSGFPLEILPSKLKTFIQRVAFAYRVPSDAVAMVALAIVSAAIGHTVRVSPKTSWKEPLFLWLIVVARSGSGKTPFVTYLLLPVFERQKGAELDFKMRQDGYEHRALIYAQQMKKNASSTVNGRKSSEDKHDAAEGKSVHGGTHNKPVPPKYEHFIADEMTLEALAVMLEGSPRGILLNKDELSGLVNGFDQYKNKRGNDRQKILTIWNCNPIKIDRVSQGGSRTISNPGLAILGGIQPVVLGEVFDDRSLSDGFLPRFITILMEEAAFEFTDDSVEQQDTEYWRNFLDGFYSEEVKECPRIIKFDAEAKTFFGEYGKRLQKKFSFLPSKYQVFEPKLRSYLVRLAGLLAVINKKDVVDRECLIGASRIIDYIASNLVKIFRLAQIHHFDRIERLIVMSLEELVPEVKNAQLKLDLLLQRVNADLDKTMHLSSKDLGGRVDKLGFHTKKNGGYYYIIWDAEKLDTLITQLKDTKSTKSSIPDQMSEYD